MLNNNSYTSLKSIINILVLLFLVSQFAFGQINNIQLDLSNEYINRTYLDTTNPLREIYKQNYVLRTDGYIYHPNLLTFNVKTDIYILSDSQIDGLTEKILNTRNIGYYDISLIFLPKQNTNIRLFSLQKKTDRDEVISDNSDSTIQNKYYSETTINQTGFTVKRNSKEKLPGIIFTINRLSAKNSTGTTWLKNLLDIKLFNKNPRENVSYSLNYRAYNYDNQNNTSDIKYDINLLANAEMSLKSKMTVRGNFIKYSTSESMIGELKHYYDSSKMLYNDFSLRLNQFKYTSGENISYRVFNRIRFDKHDSYKLRLSTNYNNRIIKRSYGNSFSESGYIKPEIIYNKRNKYLHLNGFINYNFGVIKDEIDKGFTQSINGNFRLSTVKFKKIKLSISENIGYSTFLNNLKMLRTKSGAEILINLSYRLSTGGYITWDRSQYISQDVNDYSRIIFKGIINSQPINTMRIKFEQQYSFNYSNYSDVISRSRLTISESGIMKNTVFHIIAERISMNENYQRENFNASISYRIFNFTITSGYWVNYLNDNRFDEIRVMVRRPIGIKL